MKYALLTVGAMLAAATAAPLTEEQYQYLFSKFSQQFNKNYEVQNVFSKYQTFKNNVDLIIAHNASGQSFTMEINKFADLTAAEFNQFMGLKLTAAETNSTMSDLESLIRPVNTKEVTFEPIDWIAKRMVTEPKDQGQCGSCWAFAATGALEPAARIAGKAGYDLNLSEQFLVDCSKANSGCNGGLMSLAYDYIMSKGGIPNQKDYPYTARDERCKTEAPLNPVGNPKGYKKIATNDAAHYEALKDGPVSVALAASSSAFQFYKTGVVTTCKDRGINHGVTMVGAGEQNGIKYYEIRNSWGSGWGDNGNIKLEYGTQQCGLTTSSFDVQPYY